MANTFKRVSWTNDLGQTLNPDDEVVVATKGDNGENPVMLNRGVFEGCTYDVNGDWAAAVVRERRYVNRYNPDEGVEVRLIYYSAGNVLKWVA